VYVSVTSHKAIPERTNVMKDSLRYLKKLISLAEKDKDYIGSALAEDAYRNICGWLYAHHNEPNKDLFKKAQKTVVRYVQLGGGKGVE
jgi:hypothetical protein